MARPKFTLAVSHYDRYVPFLDGSVKPKGFDLEVLHVGQSEDGRYGRDRHERMIQKGEFDICELSPMDADEIIELVQRIYATPKPVVQAAIEAMQRTEH
jgi:hypothetical protein